jgi:tetratricopeptide (TPR) repeat protein
MGVVYEAEQDHPRRVVALKVIKPGFATAETLRRFQHEAQALGRLQHPGIAQIYEASTADTGFGPQPYFAMELIRGRPLREYAEEQGLNTHQRLDSVAKICDAVEHAHQRGVIHRDLKPGNILVDDTGQPKILDFGVARVTESETQMTTLTDLGQLVGTLAYMSPEQVAGDPLALDTRSDVYALGIILYELLAGKLPYNIEQKPLNEAVAIIREEEPARISSIDRSYRGDIDTIVGKALEKDKTRRYASAADLASDIRRHLADEPITARPASATYQLQKFARRHKGLMASTAAVFLVLVAGVILTAREALRARTAEATAQAVNDFLQNDLLAQASANVQSRVSTKPDPDLKVRTALDRTAARIAGKFDRQPEVEAAIRDTIGQAYADLGLYPAARTQLERALALHRRVLGAENPITLKTMGRLGDADILGGRYPEAEAVLSQTVEIRRRVFGPEHPDTLRAMNSLATIYGRQGKYAQAETLFQQVLQVRRRVLGSEHVDTLTSMNGLANVLFPQGKYAQAVPLFTKTLEIRQRLLGPEHPETLMSMSGLAYVYRLQGQYSQAEALYRQNVEIRRRVLGPEHPFTVGTMGNLGSVYYLEGNYLAAEEIYNQALETQRRVLGIEHPDTLALMSSLALVANSSGKYVKAQTLLSQVLEIQQRVLGSDNPQTLNSEGNLASIYSDQGKYAQAEALFKKTLDIQRRVIGPEHFETLETLADIANMYQRQGDYTRAETYAAEALAGRRHMLGSVDKHTMESAADLALVHQLQGKFAKSESLAHEALDFYVTKRPDDWQRYRSESLLGASLSGQKKYAEAEPLLLEGYKGMLVRKDRIAVPDQYCLDRAREWLIALYQNWGKPDQAAKWRHR